MREVDEGERVSERASEAAREGLLRNGASEAAEMVSEAAEKAAKPVERTSEAIEAGGAREAAERQLRYLKRMKKIIFPYVMIL